MAGTTAGTMDADTEKEAVTQVATTPASRTLTTGSSEAKSVVARIQQHSYDGDEALKAFQQPGEHVELDEAATRRLLRKIDWNLMPILCVVYGLNYLDKTTLSYASIMGLKTDTHMSGTDYSWVSSMFYFGYLAWEYPTDFLLQRLPLGKYSALNIILWGITLSCFAAVQNYAGALAVRFFLGMFEAAVTPGFALLTSQWYTRREQAFRTSIWFSFNGFAQIFGGLFAYGVARGARELGSAIAPWRIIFLSTGLLTLAIGVIFLFTVPDNQLNARFLTPKERVQAVERIRGNQQGIGNKTWKKYQIKETLLDPLVWMYFFYALVADIPNGGISNFFSQLIVGFGYTPEESLLYGTPGGAVEVVTLLSWGIMTYYYGNRLLFSAVWLAAAIIGICLIVGLPLENKKGRLAGYYLTQASPAPFVALLSFISTNVAGYTKKTTVAAIFLIGYCAGNIIGPQTFKAKDEPRYVPAEITIIVCYSVGLLDIGLIYLWCSWQNTKKQRIRESANYKKLVDQEFLDLTDRENPEFTYVL